MNKIDEIMIKSVVAYLFPWQFHEKEELLPSYFRKQILPEK